MKTTSKEQIRESVRERYGMVAQAATVGCGSPSGCCGSAPGDARSISRSLGYSEGELAAVVEGANLGLGCGNPQAIADLKPGETVLDLGSGAGFDCFLAARQVGPTGQVIGVDMTPAMVSKARANAERQGIETVEFRLGEIEALPVSDGSIDAILSNCVINLSPDKPRVFREAFRVLRKGGRVAISDVVAFADLPPSIRDDLSLFTGCMAGAATSIELQETMAASGFEQIRISPRSASRQFLKDWVPGKDVSEYLVSATIEAIKPAS